MIDWSQILAVIVVILQSAGLLPAQNDPCSFSHAVALTSYNHATSAQLAARPVSDADRAALRRFDGIYDWLGYDAGGFDRPPLEQHPIEIVVTLDNHESRYVYLYDDLDPESDTQWLWAFRSLTATTDAGGEHLGPHDICASGGWPLDEVIILLEG